jgi:hypothetical protein
VTVVYRQIYRFLGLVEYPWQVQPVVFVDGADCLGEDGGECESVEFEVHVVLRLDFVVDFPEDD